MSTLHTYHCDQRSDEWFELRRGIVTASVVGRLVTSRAKSAADYDCPGCGAKVMHPCLSKTSKGDPKPIQTLHPERHQYAADNAADSPRIIEAATGDDVRTLTVTLVAERITGTSEDGYLNADMIRGIEEEPRAREKYAETHEGVEEVGFLLRDFGGYQLGLSPDGLVGTDGLLEIKAPRAKGHLQTILSDEVPVQYVGQLQAALLVSGRKWVDFVSWFGGLPMWTKRVYPDHAWHAAILAAVQTFEHNATQLLADYSKATDGLPMTEPRPDLEVVI
jgi:hypothetical protein